MVLTLAQCTGGSDSVTCGTTWTGDGWDGGFGVGQQMNGEYLPTLVRCCHVGSAPSAPSGDVCLPKVCSGHQHSR